MFLEYYSCINILMLSYVGGIIVGSRNETNSTAVDVFVMVVC